MNDLMTREPISVGPEDTVATAAGLLVESGIRHLPVVDEEGRLVGIVSDRDIRERIGGDARDWFRGARTALDENVSNLMTPDPMVVRTGTPIRAAVEILATESFGAIPVVDQDDRLIGILSYVDVLMWIRDHFSETATGGLSGDVR